MNGWKPYRKKGVQFMRPYVPGEDLAGVSVSIGDAPEDGGMIARSADNPDDQWYINKSFFKKNYEKAWQLKEHDMESAKLQAKA